MSNGNKANSPKNNFAKHHPVQHEERMKRYRDLPYIDVGSEIYNMQSSNNPTIADKSIQLYSLSLKDFFNNFGLKDKTPADKKRAVDIARKYLSLSSSNIDNIVWEFMDNEQNDKKELLQLLKDRVKIINETLLTIPRKTIRDINYEHIREKIMKLIAKLELREDIYKPEFEEELDEEELAKIADEKLIKIYLEMAWYLLNPSMVPKDIKSDWTSLVTKMDKLNLTIHDIVEHIKDSNAPNTKGVINFFKGINVASLRGKNSRTTVNTVFSQLSSSEINGSQTNGSQTVGSQTNGSQTNGSHPVGSQTVGSQTNGSQTVGSQPESKEDPFLDIKNRIKSLLMLLEIKKTVEPSRQYNTIMTDNHTRHIQTGLNISNPLQAIHRYLKNTYDPIFPLLESMQKDYDKKHKKHKNMNDILVEDLIELVKLIQGIQESPHLQYGIYVIKNLSSDSIEWFDHNIDYISKEIITKNIDKDEFHQMLKDLPSIRLSFNNTADIHYEHNPYVQFLMEGKNVAFTGTNTDIENELKPVFQNNLCFLYSTKDNENDMSLKVYEIDYTILKNNDDHKKQYPERSDSKETIEVAAVASSSSQNTPDEEKIIENPPYITEYKLDNGSDTKVKDIINIDQNICYNSSELTMSLFILFNKLYNKGMSPAVVSIINSKIQS